MSDISKVKLPDNSTYDIKDETARGAINDAVTMTFATVATTGSYNDLSSKPTIPTITLNGSSTTSPSFYAPTSAGTSGQVLTSNGSGAPTWQAPQSGGVTGVVLPDGTNLVSNGVATIPNELPYVDSSDNGQVLTVVSGAWAASTPAAGVTGVGVNEIRVMTKAQYDALDPKVLTTLYIVTE